MNKKRTNKNTKTHLFEIKHYEQIRKFIKALLFSPGMNKESIQETGVISSQRTFYDRLKNITFYMEDNVYEYKINRKKYKNILNDLYMCPANYFTNTYMYSSYTIDELFFYIFYLYRIMEDNDVSNNNFSFKEIHSLLPEDVEDILKSNKNIFYGLEQLGIIEINYKTKSTKYYKLTNDVLNYRKNNFLDNLQNMVDFFYNHHFLAVPGYYLSKTINQYKLLNDNPDAPCHYEPGNDIFAYRYVPKHNTIDNDILWDILKAIKNKQLISYTYIAQDNSKHKYSMLPVKIVIEYEYGKQYCYGYDIGSNQYFLSRIDMMENLKTTDTNYCNEEIYKHFDEDFINKWMVADNKGSYHIRVYFNFPQEKKKILKRQLENTKRFGTITENSDGSITFDITISNYKEIIPWVNSFGEYAVVDKDICPELYEEIKIHYNELRKMYEII